MKKAEISKAGNDPGTERDRTIDILRGIGMILVVSGYCGSLWTHYIYLIHMALFFMVSGYCFKSRYSDTFGSTLKFIKRRVISLWFPYFVWLTICSLLHNIFIKLLV